jgi:hypothetical protein
VVQSSIRVTAKHLSAICPTAPIRVINELLYDAGENLDVLNSILQSHAITSPQAISCFLSLVIYNSLGLTTFDFQNNYATISPTVWLKAQAERWHDLKLSAEMDGQPSSYEYAFDAMRQRSADGTQILGWGTANMGSRFDIYEKALAAFGVASCESNAQAQLDGQTDAHFTRMGVFTRETIDAEC